MPIPSPIRDLLEQGRHTEAKMALRGAAERATRGDKRDLLFEIERLGRVENDFRLTESEALSEIQSLVPETTLDDLRRWAEGGFLQTLTIDGETRHFAKNPGNLILSCEEAQQRRVAASLPAKILRVRNDEKAIDLEAHLNEVRRHEGLCCPHRFRIRHTVTVKPGEVPAGETIRCWLPIPRPEKQQTKIQLLATTPVAMHLAPDYALQRTAFFEAPSCGDEPTTFQVEYEFTAWAHHTTLDPAKILPCEINSPEVERFTREEPPVIVFTERILNLTREIIGGETNPLLRARRIIEWINANIIWLGERDYSTITAFTDLALDRGAGDCGVQAILFITMARCAGIPARWESGWWIEPGSVNMHDWARFYLRPHGWLWADLTKGGEPEAYGGSDPREFHIGNIDACRMVANADCAKAFIPPKEHWRNDTIDNQRGEMEWREGHLPNSAFQCDFEVELLGD